MDCFDKEGKPVVEKTGEQLVIESLTSTIKSLKRRVQELEAKLASALKLTLYVAHRNWYEGRTGPQGEPGEFVQEPIGVFLTLVRAQAACKRNLRAKGSKARDYGYSIKQFQVDEFCDCPNEWNLLEDNTTWDHPDNQ